MQRSHHNHTIREAVCVFESQEQLDAAIRELETTAFPRQDISVLAHGKKLEETFGTANISSENLEDNPRAPRSFSIRPEEKTIGSTAIIGICAYSAGCIAAIMAQQSSILTLLAAITGGSLVGAAIGGAAIYSFSRYLQQDSNWKIHHGGLVLWVRTPAPDKEQTAKTIMRKHGGRNVHMHEIA
ncbi:MAG: hypothetical protein LRY76_02960 [Alphaproteobacteria bacterium]|nr:hypothetical protein [Alphaproteobacteria bacterium]MCD8570483.1 hypothetical protein [Alphaproteobacteria bacterium]